MIRLLLTLAMLGGAALAQQPQPRGALPTADAQGARDSRALPRYAGSILVSASVAAFDEVLLPNARLVRVPGERDSANNALNLPPDPLRAEGRRSRLAYLLPEGRSPLEVLRGYQQAVTETGGRTLFECEGASCGGASTRSASVGGNETGIINMLMPRDQVPTRPGDPLGCITGEPIAGQRFGLLQLPNDGGHAAVLSYVMGDMVSGSECRRWIGRTVALVVVVEARAREQRMQTVSATELATGMARDGRVALYAVTFATNSADITPESAAQVNEIAAYLRTAGAARFLVVGHTDNQGGLDFNIDLSRRRAASVAAALARLGLPAARLTPQGVGMAAPVASNAEEAGRARNRRVELVLQ